MNGPLREWIEKAEEDCVAATRMVRWRRRPVPAIVCFHCQQCIEKYLKGVHVRLGMTVAHIHDLEAIPSLNSQRKDIEDLNLYSVAPRYPGFAPSIADALAAVAAMKRVRLTLRNVLGVHRKRKRTAKSKKRKT